jgi:hypothetical protein
VPWRRVGKCRYTSNILDISIGWREVVSFRPLPHYPRGKNLWYPLDRRLRGPQRRSGCYGQEKNLALTGTQNSDPSAFQPVASRYTDCVIPAMLKVVQRTNGTWGTQPLCLQRYHCTTNISCHRGRPQHHLSHRRGASSNVVPKTN